MRQIAGISQGPIKLPGTGQTDSVDEGFEDGLFAAMLLQLLGQSPQQGQGVLAEGSSPHGTAISTEGAPERAEAPLTLPVPDVEPDESQGTRVDETVPSSKELNAPKPESLPTQPGTVIVHDPPMVLSPEALLYRGPTRVATPSAEKGELDQDRPTMPSQAPVMTRQRSHAATKAQVQQTWEPLKVRAGPDHKPRPVRLVERAEHGPQEGTVRPEKAVHPPLIESLPEEAWQSLIGLKETRVIFHGPDLIQQDRAEAILDPQVPAVTTGPEQAPLTDHSQGKPPDVPVEQGAPAFIVEEASPEPPEDVPLERIPLEPEASALSEDWEVPDGEDQGEPRLKEPSTHQAEPRKMPTLAAAKEPPRTAEPIQEAKGPEKTLSQEPVGGRKPAPLPDALPDAREGEVKFDQPEAAFRIVEEAPAPEFEGTKPVEGAPREVPREAPSEKGVAQQVLRQMSLDIRPGVQEVLIRLEPRELGDVRLRIISQGGEITARIAVETQSVKAIMESAMPELRTNLQQQGLQLVDFSVQVGTNGFSFDQASPQHRERQWTHGGKRAAAREEPAYVQTDGGWQLGRVDIRA
jgi:hypothetical protein